MAAQAPSARCLYSSAVLAPAQEVAIKRPRARPSGGRNESVRRDRQWKHGLNAAFSTVRSPFAPRL